jgi:hypothetical protein
VEEDMKHPHRPAGDKRTTMPAQDPSVGAAADAPGDELQLRIREAAYYRYLARGAEIGHDMEDWLQAEAALLEAEKEPGPGH